MDFNTGFIINMIHIINHANMWSQEIKCTSILLLHIIEYDAWVLPISKNFFYQLIKFGIPLLLMTGHSSLKHKSCKLMVSAPEYQSL